MFKDIIFPVLHEIFIKAENKKQIESKRNPLSKTRLKSLSPNLNLAEHTLRNTKSHKKIR